MDFDPTLGFTKNGWSLRGGRRVGRELKTVLISWKDSSLPSFHANVGALVRCYRGYASWESWWMNLPKYLTFWMKDVSSLIVVGEGRASSALTLDGSTCMPTADTSCPNKATYVSPMWHFAIFNCPPICANLLKPSSTLTKCNTREL